MTFNDIFKSSFLENVTSVSILDMLLTIALSFCIGLFIFFVYKRTYRGVMYSADFGTTLLALTMITSIVILAVTSNVVLSLGMVGALSIVRFRTAVKDPLDIAFLFWSIAAGIVLGAGLIPLAIFGSIIIGVVMILFVNHKSHDNPYLLVLVCENDAAEKSAVAHVEKSVKRSAVKAKTVDGSGIELTMEVRLQDMTTDFVNTLSAMPGVKSAALVGYNGEYME